MTTGAPPFADEETQVICLKLEAWGLLDCRDGRWSITQDGIRAVDVLSTFLKPLEQAEQRATVWPPGSRPQ